MLEAAIEDFMRSRPGMVGGPLAGLAELRRRQGRSGEAAQLCERAEGSSSGQLCLARMALDRGDAQDAADLVERLLRNVPEHRRLSRAPALELLVRARAASGDLDGGRGRAGRAARGRARGRDRRRCARAPTSPRARSPPPAATTTARACCSRTPSTPSRAAARRSRPPRRGSRSPRASPRSGAREAAERESAAARERLRELGAPAAPPLPELTPREREVLALLAEGLTNRGIAERLVVSEHTVHRHVTSILRKLDLGSRTAAAALAVRAGLS